MIEIYITQTARDNLREKPVIFDHFNINCKSIQEVKEFFIERYSRVPNGKNKIYMDVPPDTSIEVGFTYSYWNQDVSHNSKKWFQTDWISLYEVNRKPLDNLKF